MKKDLLLLGGITLFAPTLTLSAQEAEMFRNQGRAMEESSQPFGSFFLGDRPYSPTFGLSLWNTGGDLQEVTYKDVDTKNWREIDLPDLTGIRDYSKLGYNKVLRFEGDQGSAVLFRVREKFQLLNEETGGAQFAYSNDLDSHSETASFKGSLMLDVYQNALYNGIWKNNIWWIQNPYRFWVRSGLEWDYQDVTPDNSSDMFRQYFLLTFQANPDQNLTLFGNDFLRIDSPQIVQFGVVHEENRITNDDSLRWIVGWEPRFLINTGFFAQNFGRGFGLNQKMYYKKDSFGTLAASVVEKSDTTDGSGGEKSLENYLAQSSPVFSFINPYVGIEGNADSRVTLPALITDPSFDSLKKLQDEVLRYYLSVGIGMELNDRFLPAENREHIFATLTLAYKLHGVQPLSHFSDGHVWHEIRADLNFKQIYPSSSPSETENPNNWAGLTAYVSYLQGEPPPTHESIDLLTAGISLRF